jgi:hypothetical protein
MDPLVYRIASNYMPVNQVGNTWTYELPGSGESLVTIIAEDAILGRDCLRVQIDFEDSYWYRDEDQFDVYVRTVYLYNEEHVIEERWARHLVLPLVLGSKWTEEYEETTLVYGQSVTRKVLTEGKVTSIQNVTVPAGGFEQCYVVRLEIIGETETPYGNGWVDSTFVEEYYAPDIGLVRRVDLLTQEVEVLESFTLR